MALTSADRLISPAVNATLGAIDVEPRFEAAAKLAERYAAQLDDAHWTEKRADDVLKMVEQNADDVELLDAVQALRAKLSARSAVENLGPKLAALLDALGATPMGKAKLDKIKPPEDDDSGNWLAKMRNGQAG